MVNYDSSEEHDDPISPKLEVVMELQSERQEENNSPILEPAEKGNLPSTSRNISFVKIVDM